MQVPAAGGAWIQHIVNGFGMSQVERGVGPTDERPGPHGRLRAIYAVAAGSLEAASLAVKAVWLICVLVLAALIGGILAAVFNAIF